VPHREGSIGFYHPRKLEAYIETLTELPNEIDRYRTETRGEISEVQTAIDRVEKKVDELMAREGTTKGGWSDHQSAIEPTVFRPSDDRPGFGLMDPFSSIPIPQFGMFQSAGPNP